MSMYEPWLDERMPKTSSKSISEQLGILDTSMEAKMHKQFNVGEPIVAPSVTPNWAATSRLRDSYPLTNVVKDKPFSVDIETLVEKYPECSFTMLSKVIDNVGKLSLSDITRQFCSQWDLETQEKYGLLIHKSIQLNNSRLVVDSTQHLNRLYLLIDNFTKYVTISNNKGFLNLRAIKLVREFDKITVEIKELIEILTPTVQPLLAFQEEVAACFDEFDDLINDLITSSITLNCIIDILNGLEDSSTRQFVNILEQQDKAIISLVENIKTSQMIRHTNQEAIRELVAQINSIVINKIPTWLEYISSLNVFELTETTRYMLVQNTQELKTV